MSPGCILCPYSPIFVMSENKDIFVLLSFIFFLFQWLMWTNNFCYPIEEFGTNYAAGIET